MREQHADHLQYRFDGQFDGGRPSDGARTLVGERNRKPQDPTHGHVHEGQQQGEGGDGQGFFRVLNEYRGVWARPAASTDASLACQLHWKTQRKTQEKEFSIKV